MEENSSCKETCITKIKDKIELLFAKSEQITAQQELLDSLRRQDLELRGNSQQMLNEGISITGYMLIGSPYRQITPHHQQLLLSDGKNTPEYPSNAQIIFTMDQTSISLDEKLNILCATIDQETKTYFQLLSEYLSICSDLLNTINECKNCIISY